MIRSLLRIAAPKMVTAVLLGAILVATAGVTCLFSSPVRSSSAGSAHTGCHPGPAPTKSRSHDMRCCVNSPARALPIVAFSPSRAAQAIGPGPVSVHFFLSSPGRDGGIFPAAQASSAGPPAVTTLRI